MSETKRPVAEETLYEDLVIAVLAVNNHAVEKVFLLRDGLRKQGLFDPDTVTGWNHEAACAALKGAGYDRGPYYGSILASRLQELAAFASKGGVKRIADDLKAGRRTQVEQTLLAVHGIGPAVMRNFWMLQKE